MKQGNLENFLLDHLYFKCAIVAGRAGIEKMVQLAETGDTVSNCVATSILYWLEIHLGSEETYKCIACDAELPAGSSPLGFVVLYGEVDKETADTACTALCDKCATLPMDAISEIIHLRLEIEAGGEIDITNQGPPKTRNVH